MIIEWTGDTTGLELKPTWEVEEVRLHTVKNMLQPDGVTRADTLVLYVRVTEEQLRTLKKDYGDHSFSTGLLGLNVIPLYANAVLWTWKAPKGHEHYIKDGTYTAFRIGG